MCLRRLGRLRAARSRNTIGGTRVNMYEYLVDLEEMSPSLYENVSGEEDVED